MKSPKLTCRQSIQDQVTILIHPDQIARFELVRGYQPDHRQKDGLSGRGLDDGAFRIGRRGRRGVLSCALFRGRFVRHIQDLRVSRDRADEV